MLFTQLPFSVLSNFDFVILRLICAGVVNLLSWFHKIFYVKRDNISTMLQLCRLCLVKDNVNIPIFEEQGDISQIFQKISSCLPVKVSWRHPPCYCFGFWYLIIWYSTEISTFDIICMFTNVYNYFIGFLFYFDLITWYFSNFLGMFQVFENLKDILKNFKYIVCLLRVSYVIILTNFNIINFWYLGLASNKKVIDMILGDDYK